MAKDFDGKSEAEFWLAAGNRVGSRCDCAGVRLPPVLFVDLPGFVRICRGHGSAGILSWGESDSLAIRRFVYGIGGGPDDAQYAALRRLPSAFWGGGFFFSGWPRRASSPYLRRQSAQRSPSKRGLTPWFASLSYLTR